MIPEETKIRTAVAGLNLAWRVEKDVACFVDKQRREARMTIALVQEIAEDTLHAILAAFATGATEIRWSNGASLCFSPEATPIGLPQGDMKQ